MTKKRATVSNPTAIKKVTSKSNPSSTLQEKKKEASKPSKKILEARKAKATARLRRKFYLELIGKRPTWIHRRVETISFLSDDSTKRRVSYDFTLPPQAKKFALAERIGVPIDNMRKETLKDLSITDAGNKALSIWGTEQNGTLGVEVLEALVSGHMSRNLHDDEKELIRHIVFSESIEKAQPSVTYLLKKMEGAPGRTENEYKAAKAFVEELAKNFIFVVEIPKENIGVRTIIKLSYDMEMNDERASIALLDLEVNKSKARRGFLVAQREKISRKVSEIKMKIFNRVRITRKAISITENFPVSREFFVESKYLPSSQSEHLEIHAPEDLQIISLKRYRIDEKGRHGEATETSAALGHIGHIRFKNDTLNSYESAAFVEFAPVIPGLVIQTFTGVLLGMMFLVVELVGRTKLYSIIHNIGDAGPLAAIALALPAFLLSLLVRSREHNYVKAILKAPRAIAFLSACTLFIAASSLVLKLSIHHFFWILCLLTGVQGALFLIMSWVTVIVHRANRPL